MTDATSTAVSTSITVDVPVALAFTVFTEDMASWWPPGPPHSAGPVGVHGLRAASRWSRDDVGEDGSECQWARASWCMSLHIAWSSAGTSVSSGRSSRTRPGRARSRCGSSPRRPPAPGSSWSTATLTATARAGRACATQWLPPKVGTSASSVSPGIGARRGANRVTAVQATAQVFQFQPNPPLGMYGLGGLSMPRTMTGP